MKRFSIDGKQSYSYPLTYKNVSGKTETVEARGAYDPPLVRGIDYRDIPIEPCEKPASKSQAWLEFELKKRKILDWALDQLTSIDDNSGHKHLTRGLTMEQKDQGTEVLVQALKQAQAALEQHDKALAQHIKDVLGDHQEKMAGEAKDKDGEKVEGVGVQQNAPKK